VKVEHSSALVSAQWLKQHQHDAGVVIIEFSSDLASYDHGHIDGAHYLDWRTDIIDSSEPQYYSILPQSDYEALLRRLGVKANSTLVVYDEMSSRAAVRFFWTLKYYGQRDVRVLDGGKNSWLSAGLPLSKLAAEVEPSDYRVTEVRSELLVERNTIERGLRGESQLLVDGRPFDQYSGKVAAKVYHTAVTHQRLGHIYGAKSVPWASNFNPDGTFKSPVELRKLYEEHHIVPQASVVTYCNEGLHAAVPWFVLSQLLGYPSVSLYDKSLAEWANRLDTAMLVGERCM
jgi:thiosulfate/3-mercaptopyruvate sulfurtransferase